MYNNGTRIRVRSGQAAFTKKEGYGISSLLLENNFIKKGHIRGIRFNTLEQLCLALRCQPGDLLEVMSEEDARKEFGLDWSAED